MPLSATKLFRILAACVGFGVGVTDVQAANEINKARFANEVWPLLSERCLACHGKDLEKIKGGLDLRSAASALKGGDSERPSIVPGEPEQSPLYLASLRTHDDWDPMPPKENDALNRKQLNLLKQWITDGATWLSESERGEIANKSLPPGFVRVDTSGGLDATWTDRPYELKHLWAYQPLAKLRASGDGNPIDSFMSVDPAKKIDARILIRRLSFDLTGLPPSPAEVHAFVTAKDSDRAYHALVDRLLKSPHFGERQAQHWLDVTRYADTDGGSNDYERAGVWRYRDYVVRSFNNDKPYDLFVREQLAGDQLKPDDSEAAIAVGFLRMGPWEATGMNPAAIIRQQFLDDVVNHVGEVFLAQPLRCAKCHDHKFDPIPTRDYYRFTAAFGDTHPAEIDAPFLATETKPDGSAEEQRVAREVKRINALLDGYAKTNFKAGRDWLKRQGIDTAKLSPRLGGKFNVFGSQFSSIEEAQRPPKNIGLTDQQITHAAVLFKHRRYLERGLEKYAPVAFAVYSGGPNQYNSHKSRNPAAMKGTNAPVHILSGGALDAPLEAVEPGALSCVESLGEHEFDAAEASPRLQLAHWIASPQNPLTARVLVNRIWQQHFPGQGLVATPNNFGYTGAKPSNPELLDFLANWFIENGWSIKQLHPLIVTSDAYRRTIIPRRLHAEEIRDAMLAISGELNPAIGGPPVYPEINLEAALQPRYVQSSVAPAYQPSPLPSDRHRRTLYAFRMRGLPDPALEVFNRPSADLSCERRNATTVTPQVFALFNGQQPHDRSLALARRLEREAESEENRIALAYELVFGRAAKDREIKRAIQFVRTQTAEHQAHPPQPVAMPKSVRRSMVFEMTGVTSEWNEPLDIYATTFVPDLKPWDVPAKTRALAAFCLVLFNSNEFLYLR